MRLHFLVFNNCNRKRHTCLLVLDWDFLRLRNFRQACSDTILTQFQISLQANNMAYRHKKKMLVLCIFNEFIFLTLLYIIMREKTKLISVSHIDKLFSLSCLCMHVGEQIIICKIICESWTKNATCSRRKHPISFCPMFEDVVIFLDIWYWTIGIKCIIMSIQYARYQFSNVGMINNYIFYHSCQSFGQLLGVLHK